MVRYLRQCLPKLTNILSSNEDDLVTNIFIIYFQLDQEVCSQGTSTTSKRRFEHGADDDGATT